MTSSSSSSQHLYTPYYYLVILFSSSSLRNLILLSLPCCSLQATTSTAYSRFYKAPLQGSYLLLHETFLEIESLDACASACVEWTPKRPKYLFCMAFRHDSVNKACEAYSQGEELVTSSSLHLFSLDPKSRYDDVIINGHVFYIHVSHRMMPYLDGTPYCNRLGGYMLELDMIEKYDAIGKLLYGTHIVHAYVGANDIVEEGKWVTERNGLPLDNSTWIWRIDEPQALSEDEDGGAISVDVLKVIDMKMTKHRNILCERDP